MNSLFHLNMQNQIAANQAARNAAMQALQKIMPAPGSPTYTYLQYIFSHGKASSQQLRAQRPDANKWEISRSLSIYIERGYISFTRVDNHGGIYQPINGTTAAMLGIDMDEPA